MPGFSDALSGLKERFSDYVSNRMASLKGWMGLKRKRYYLSNKYRIYKDYFVENLYTYGKAYSKYFLFEFAPYVVAYGLMVNFPVSVLLAWGLTVETVVSWGLAFYFVSEELPAIANELKPYIRVSAKVDN